MKINIIKTDVGDFIQLVQLPYSGSGLESFLFNGEKPEKTYNDKWVKIKQAPALVQKSVGQPNINRRWELIDPEMASAKIPLTLTIEQAEETSYADWQGEFAHLQSLYTFKSDPQEPKLEEVAAEWNVILELDKIEEYAGFSYPVQRTQWASDGFVNLTERAAHHEAIDTILFPDLVLAGRQSKLTSKQSFNIVRKHVQDNINPKYAKISSDYNFCFQVDKKIALAEKVPYTVDVNNSFFQKRKRKSKWETRYRSDRAVKIFEMTHSEEKWKDYTPIKGFEGKNIQDLKENIDKFLEELMEVINEPVRDCDKCCGCGIILQEEFKHAE